MRQMRSFFVLALVALAVASCEKNTAYVKTIDFEDVVLGEDGYYNGSDKSGTVVDGSYRKDIRSSFAIVVNHYAESEWGGFWKGFSISSLTDTVTRGYTNQYSSIAASGAAGSAKFALAYASTGDSALMLLKPVDPQEMMEVLRPKKMMITNSVYAYHTIKEGDMFSTKFEDGDWFKVIIRGYNQSTVSGSVEFYLADFRNGKKVIVKEWTSVDLSQLGVADRIVLTFDSSDKTGGWINTPAYACIDNIEIEYSEE